MIKVLGKIFEVLETVVCESPNPMTPMEISGKLNMNRPTCSRILKELTDAGYLIRISRQSGYAVGPRSFTFGGMVKYKSQLLEKARPYIKDCAFQLSKSVLLCERQGCERYILSHYNYSPLNIRLKQLSFHDLFETATGMVLTAYAPRNVQEELYHHYRENKYLFFPELKRFEDVLESFEQIKRERIFIRDKFRTLQWIAAVPVCRNGIVTAALGLSAPAADADRNERPLMITELKKTAELISNELSTIETTG